MNQPRDAVYQALLNQIAGATGTTFVTLSRRLLGWDKVTADKQPALFLRARGEKDEQSSAYGITRYQMACLIVIYAKVPTDPAAVPQTLALNLLDAVDNALAVPVGEKQTLNGMVTNCWIDGECAVDEGVPFDDQIVVTIPVSILTGSS